MKPTDDKCTYTSIDVRAKIPPSITFSAMSILWIKALVENHSEEVGFFGVVDDTEPNTYKIRDIFYPKHQLITSGTCEISPEGEAQIVNWLCEHGRVADLSKLRLWGHSHHTMGVFASHQDEQQSLERMNQNQSYLIRVIVNKDYKMDVAFFDYERQIKFEHVPWTIDAPTEAEFQAILDEKLALIASVLAETKSASEKLSEIDKITKQDPVADEIKAKVLKLKALNVPVQTAHGYSGDGYHGGCHYDHHGGYPPYYDYEGFENESLPFASSPGSPGRIVVVGGQQRTTASRQEYGAIVDKHMRGGGRGKKNRQVIRSGSVSPQFTGRFNGGA